MYLDHGKDITMPVEITASLNLTYARDQRKNVNQKDG